MYINPRDGAFVTTISNVPISSFKYQTSSKHVSSKNFEMNTSNAQKRKRKSLNFHEKYGYEGISFDMITPILSYVLSYTNFGNYQFTDKNVISNFCVNLHIISKRWDKLSARRKMIMNLRRTKNQRGPLNCASGPNLFFVPLLLLILRLG